jgi:hypothetical protein
MGYFRFRRRIKIAPGVHWNIGKKGSSISLGGHGFTHTVGPKASRTTIGIPGTGVSYTQVHSHSKPTASPPPPSSVPASQLPTKSSASKFFYVFGVILLVIWLLGKFSEQKAPSANNVYPLGSPSPSVSFSSSSRSSVTERPRYSAKSSRTASTPSATYSANPTYSPIDVRRALPVESDHNAVASPSVTQTPQSWVYPTAPSQSPFPTPVAHTYRVVNIIAGDFLYLRSGPGSSYHTVARIPPGTRGIVLGTKRAANGSTMWQEISVGGYVGWVNEIYLEAELWGD